jgi:hypothetical protein
LPKDASSIDEFDEQHKLGCYFDHSLTLKLVEFFLLAEKFLLPDEVKTAALDKVVPIIWRGIGRVSQKPKLKIRKP